MIYSPLATPRATIARLQELGLSTKKSLGQHFLIDDNTIGRIIDLAALEPSDTILEVGPGIGTLTVALQERVARIIAIEYDRTLIGPLAELIDPKRVEIIEGDAARILREPPEQLTGIASKLVANLPYQVAATVVLRAFENIADMTGATVMVQAEVADRMRAVEGTKDYSAYTVKLALLAKVAGHFEVARSNFLPPPRVDSVVIRLDRANMLETHTRYRAVREVIDASFAMRRKTLRNNLRAIYPSEAIDQALTATGIDGSSRAETLDTEQFIALTQHLTEEW
ncbi:MAG: 16S rRNA (adenine(1518)-N(6)/adenine(1519)-N(6))-dimethyltransferase RsmA [Coriobacteriia bacterium]|nr:16S rRNA (adenine(1518)-N(6)/adenine(1519)-N(6))-dimethyltransferase RsmA [Coriobacteriia bacterium]